MNKPLLLISLASALLVLVSGTHANAADISVDEAIRCETNISRQYQNDTQLFRFLESKGIPRSIEQGGRTLYVNKDRLINYCELVYGKPSDVRSDGKRHQSYDSRNQPFFLGYSDRGKMYPNYRYRDTYHYQQYIRNLSFIREPWNNSTLVSQGNNPSFEKPAPLPPSYARPEDGYGKEYELSRAIDRMYIYYNPTGSLGAKGYFPSKFGSNLNDFASVLEYPTDYSMGVFTLYFPDPNRAGVIRYGTFMMAQHKKLFDAPGDLELVNAFTITPDDPQATGTVADVVLQVKNNTATNYTNVSLAYGWSSSSTVATQQEIPFHINGNETKNIRINDVHYPRISGQTSTRYFSANVNPGRDNPTSETNWNNNKRSWPISVKNPNAAVTVSTRDNSDLHVRIHNLTFNTIAQDCTVSGTYGCKSGTSMTYTSVNVYDTRNTLDTSDDLHIDRISIPNFTIPSGQSRRIDIPTPPSDGTVKKYRIMARIPEYLNEVDSNGSPKYQDNRIEGYFTLYPDLPPVTLTDCTTLNVGYVTELSGIGPVKSCAGHYPKHPSTTVENGMGVYHFVLWRFFASPLPAYQVTNPTVNADPPNAFQQTFSVSEPSDSVGNKQTFLYHPSGSNSEGLSGPYFQPRGSENMYRGRLFPTDATFTFSVYDTLKDTGASGYRKNVLIAYGSLAHDIPPSCYNSTTLDMIHSFGCDEILFFLPNAQNNMSKRPPNHSGENIDFINSPISTTKIPYLNPGKYVFELDAKETFQYRYQHDDGYLTSYSDEACYLDSYNEIQCYTYYWEDLPWNRVWSAPRWYNNTIY